MKLVRSKEVEWQDSISHGPFLQRRKALGGGEKLGVGLWELAPGKKSFPLHVHHVTEEALYVVSGRAIVRTPEGETEIGPGDCVTFPPGGPAHQLRNDFDEPCVYIGMSAGERADVVQYPDTGKVACRVGSPPTGKRFLFDESKQVGYFDGEK